MEEQEKTLPDEARLLQVGRRIASRLREAGYEAWFVGGCVRDRLLGVPLKDIDIATNARPEDAAPLFAKTRFVGARFGVLLVIEDDIQIEVATFRKDGAYLDHRHPETVEYGTMEDDVQRRDFTINALFQNPESGEIRDLVHGEIDLEAKLIRCVGEPHRRFNEDALRLLRAIRFATRLGFHIEPETWSAMVELAPTIQYISPERQREELTRMFTGPAPGRAIRLMDQCGLLHFILPEIEVMKGIEQGRRFHPEGDVFVHTCLVMDKLEPKTPVTAWAALLHDVGKPVTYERSPGKISFYEHERVGADMAREIMERFRFSNEEIETVASIVKNHMQFMNVEKMKKSTLRRFVSRPTIEQDLAIHRADILGSCGYLDYYNFVREKMQEFEQTQKPAMPPPLLTGKDLIEMGFQPGPKFGEILGALQELQLEDEVGDSEAAREWVLEKYGRE